MGSLGEHFSLAPEEKSYPDLAPIYHQGLDPVAELQL